MEKWLGPMYLVDTNIWLERLLEQERADEVGAFLDVVPASELWMTDFAFHSIGVIVTKLGKTEVLSAFVQDVLADGNARLIHLEPGDTGRIIAAITRFDLDFDDAYQYTAAEKYDLEFT